MKLLSKYDQIHHAVDIFKKNKKVVQVMTNRVRANFQAVTVLVTPHTYKHKTK